MAHVIEPAASGRAKCRGCGRSIGNNSLRFGERLPNPYADGEMTLWFHPRCAAYKRPGPLLETLEETDGGLDDAESLRSIAREGIAHRRLPRVDGAQRSPTGRARCRCCRKMIEKDSWRLALVYYEDGRFEPSGFIHAGCAREYLETTDLVDRAGHFSPELSADDLAELSVAVGGDKKG